VRTQLVSRTVGIGPSLNSEIDLIIRKGPMSERGGAAEYPAIVDLVNSLLTPTEDTGRV
jgi:hypothetical protein